MPQRLPSSFRWFRPLSSLQVVAVLRRRPRQLPFPTFPFPRLTSSLETGAEAVNGKTLSVNYTGWLYDADEGRAEGRPIRHVHGGRTLHLRAWSRAGHPGLGSRGARDEGRRQAAAGHSARFGVRSLRAGAPSRRTPRSCSTSNCWPCSRTDCRAACRRDGLRGRSLSHPARRPSRSVTQRSKCVGTLRASRTSLDDPSRA